MMTNNVLLTSYKFAKNIFIYRPPSEPHRFVLEEWPAGSRPEEAQPQAVLLNSLQQLEALIRYAQRLSIFLTKVKAVLAQEKYQEDIPEWQAEYEALEKQHTEVRPILSAYKLGSEVSPAQPLSTSLEENHKTISAIYHLPLNKDIVIREINITADPPVSALVIFIDGMVDTKLLNLAVMQPLMLIGSSERKLYRSDLVDRIVKECLPSNQVQRAGDFSTLEEGINNGDTAIIFDGIAEGVIVNTRGWEHRSIERPNTEPTVRGSQAGFTENLRTNTTLIRTIMRTSDLVTEMLKVGTRSKTNVALVYLKNVANPQLVGELRRRIQGVRTDNIDSSGTLIQFIEDHPILPFPQSLSTEHPDRVMPHLSEGRLALIVDGNPYIHVLPVSFFTLFHSAEDFGMPILVANFMRLLRLFGALLATLLPSLYIAISYFHVEALPTQLLLAIAGSREEVPFAAWFEVLIMEISFELIREAGVRVPGILGSTIGIVGAIILGQAAISAHVVSPAVVVVIAITGLASFTIPDYHMAASIRLVRFLLLLFSTFMGLVGLATILLWLTVILCSMKSFGMPYMVPVGPATNRKSFDVVIRGPVYSQKVQLDAINTKPDNRQPRISRSWIKRHPVEKEDE